MSIQRYVQSGVSPAELASQLPPGVTAIPSAPMPRVLIDINLSDDSARPDLDGAMGSAGFVYAETAPEVAAAKVINQIERARRTTNLNVGLGGWQPVLSQTIRTRGGSVLAVYGTNTATVAVGAEGRLLINGGAFANNILDRGSFAALTGAKLTLFSEVDIPSTSTYVEYTVTMQAQAVLALSSILFDTGYIAVPARLLLVEYV